MFYTHHFFPPGIDLPKVHRHVDIVKGDVFQIFRVVTAGAVFE